MTLQDMFRTIWFGKWLVLVSVLAALGGAYLYVSRQEPQYASTATVQIVDAETLAAAGVRLESDPSLVTSDSVTAAAAKELGDPGLADGLAASSTAEYATDSPSNVIITETGPDADATVDRANAIAKAYVAALQAQFDDDLAAMQERLSNLATSIDQQQKAITDARRAAAAATSATNPNAQVDPVDGLLEAQYSTTMDQYQTLSGQLTQAQLLASPATILQNAVGSALVSLPGSLVYLIAGLAGLLVGIGLAVVRRGLDTKVRTSGQARRSAGAPVLARLSGTGAALKSAETEGTLPVARREATAYTRSIRELRTALQAAVENESGSAVIVVTAADVETPRSFLAANLAASWALSGRSVVVLSGDLRQPRLNALLPADADAPVRPGRGGGRARTAVVPTAIPHLAVHPALQTELDPADFLASADVRALVEQLRATADVVIIDAPPMLVAADATILGSYADGVLLAVTLGHTHVGAVEESAERLRAANAALLGLSVDGTTERSEATYAATYAFAGAEEVPQEPAQDAEGDRAGDDRAADDRAADDRAGDDRAADAPAEDAATGGEPADGAQTPADRDATPAADAPADAESEVPAPRADGQHRAADRPAEAAEASPDEPADDAAARSGEDRAPVAAESK
ncbi:Wzz/FepE/Etk N-terminal domain-containing protein [Cellulomonas sp. ACRRI]|uniref:polysaccharide biosynthesis tyrosine autokinase n=1 Tax=Cellulomonas sp. ACRRI TaxID=2918188 RepID=UPI001EF2BCF2|nr:Wzz/FepE/Etk N-terminal domain-containing protein [Cellulomonas sp. ACRRI]MCG7285727.1 Wzz/FepE/Etk N-terminal domain-containing protein [Cellulomonas sp. ACRRI]